MAAIILTQYDYVDVEIDNSETDCIILSSRGRDEVDLIIIERYKLDEFIEILTKLKSS